MVASKRRLRTLKRQKNSRDDGHVSVITRVTGNLASAIDTTNSHIKSPHVFETDALDHAETERRAYCHVAPVLKLLAEKLALKPKDLKIWDPYFCKGTVVRYLAEVGFYKVRNLNEDFYKVQQVGLPDYEVLLTNPPYSSNHLERCLEFCVKSAKPCLLLLPFWVAKKPYFSCVLGDRLDSVFFIAPLQRYQYTMPSDLVPDSCKPSWVGEDGQTSPFQSCWYVYLPPSFNFTKFFEALKCRMGKFGPFDCVVAKRLQAVKWKLKKASAETRQKDEIKDQDNRKRKHVGGKQLRPQKRPAVPGTVEFD